MSCCFAAVLPAACLCGRLPLCLSGRPRTLALVLPMLADLACGRPPRCRGGAPAGPAISLFTRSRYDPVVEDDFALAVPDYVCEVGVTGDDLGCNATRKQSCPSQYHEAPVQRCAEEFFHEPEGVTPFVQPYVRQNHERTSNGHDQRKRGAPRVQRQTRHGIQVARHAADDVHQEGAVEHYHMARGEARVAYDDLVPRSVLLSEEAAAPVNTKQVHAQPHHPVEVT